MIKIAFVGEIGSGKTFIAKMTKYPLFNADYEVSRIYKTDISFFKKLNKKIPKYFKSFPILKVNLVKAILQNNQNLKKITKIVHPLVRKKMNIFLKKNMNKKFVILDIPLYLENNLNKKNDIIIFVQSNKSEINKRLKKRKYFNKSLLDKFRKLQYSAKYKKKKANFIIKNDFNRKNTKIELYKILKKIS